MAISMKHKSITIDVNDRNAPNIVAIANVNDKAVRYLDVMLTASGEKLTFADCTVTATFATDGYLISDSVACTLNSTADVITVPLENFNSMSGFLAIEIKIANGETQVLNTPLALKVKVTPSLLDKSMISKDSVGTAAEICREVATARGKSSSLNARLNGIDSAVTNKAEKSTVSQLSAKVQTAEKALTGKANATDVSNALKSKENNSNKVSSKTGITDSSTNYPSIKYLDDFYYDASEIYSSEEMNELLGNKADKVDVSKLKNDLVKLQNLISDSNKIPVSFIFGGMSTDPNSEYIASKKNSRAYSDVTFTSTIAIQFQGISVSVRYFNNEFDLEKSTDWITQSPLIIETNNYYGFRLVVKNDDDTDINLANLSEQLSVYTEKNSVINFIRGVYEPVVGNSISNIMNKPNRCSLTKIFKITDTMMVVVPKGYSISYRVVNANQNIEKSSDWIGNNFAIHDGEYVFTFKRSDEAKMSYIDVINLSEFNITKHIDVEYTFSNTGTYENNSLTTYKNSGFISCAIGDTFEYCIRIKGGYAVRLFDKDKNLISKDIHIATTNKSNDFTFSGTYRISKPSVKYIWFDTMNDTHNDYQYYKPSIKMLTDSKSSPNLTIRCAKEKTYNDGTPPKIEWYLLEDVNTEIFYKSKDFSNIERLFCWDNDFSSLDYSFGITKDNDIIAVFKTESLDDLSTHDDSRRKNPFVFDAKNNYACIEVNISDKIKPSGWLSNTGYRVLPDGTILFCEYTRPSVATTNVWRIDSNSDIKNPSNWIVVKSFNLSGDLYSGLKHCHMIMYDHYAGITYLSTGDDDIGSQVWHSKDGGITWTQTRDASEKYCRMLNYVFLEDYIYWSSDTAVKNYHYIFRAPRKEDGVIDYDNVTDLQLIPYIDTHVATYGVSYLKDLNLLQLIERVDGTGNATEMPIRGYDLATNSLVTLGVIKSVDGVGHNLGFRTEYTEWYPNDGIIKFGFGGKYTWNSAINCNKGFGNVASYTEKCCVNNLTMKPFKNDNKFGVKFDTIIIN